MPPYCSNFLAAHHTHLSFRKTHSCPKLTPDRKTKHNCNMKNTPDNISKSQTLALARYAAVCFIQEAINQNFSLVRAAQMASQRQWNGKLYSPSTLLHWYHCWKHGDFQALQPQSRKDKGTPRVFSPADVDAILKARTQHPQLTVKCLIRHLISQGVLQAGSFSLPSVYRLLAAHNLDSHSIKLLPQNPQSGPTKAFQCPLANQLWMADVSHGPTIKLPSGQTIRTRLIAILDDCSRLVPHAQYYPDETLCCFLDTLKQALAKRGIPDKLYTDNGKIFTSHHLKIVCANLNIKLIHAKPFAAWSKGKMERWFRTVQSDFEAQLALQPVDSLQLLNHRFWQWLETQYHQRPHSALEGLCPAQRFAQAAHTIRIAPADTDWEALFLCQTQRRVRLDATFSLAGQLWEVPPHLRGQLILVKFDPFNWSRVEVWFRNQLVGQARPCDKHLNSKTYTDRDYERH